MKFHLSICWTRCEARSVVEHAMKVRLPPLHHHVMPMAAFKIPRFIPHTKSTPQYESDTTGQVFFLIRMDPTSPDLSDHSLAPHNPWVVSWIPTGPTHRPTKTGSKST